jgi:hypothetical protein
MLIDNQKNHALDVDIHDLVSSQLENYHIKVF